MLKDVGVDIADQLARAEFTSNQRIEKAIETQLAAKGLTSVDLSNEIHKARVI